LLLQQKIVICFSSSGILNLFSSCVWWIFFWFNGFFLFCVWFLIFDDNVWRFIVDFVLFFLICWYPFMILKDFSVKYLIFWIDVVLA
jgi:hypothetical protein